MNLKKHWLALLPLMAASIAIADDSDDSDDKWDVNNIPGEARTISIDTRTGTWMSLDVSPDGSTIAFDLLGDIYVLPISGGEASAINSGLSWSMQPRFSPDGSQIAFQVTQPVATTSGSCRPMAAMPGS